MRQREGARVTWWHQDCTSAIDLSIFEPVADENGHLTWTLTACAWYALTMDMFLTVTEAVKRTGKSRRTITRLANRLAQAGSDQVMREKRARGYSWRISPQSLQDAFSTSVSQTVPTEEHVASQPLPVPTPPEHTLEIARHGYTGMMTMHQEVKQAYEALLAEKEQRITRLSQALVRSRKGWWAWLFGH